MNVTLRAKRPAYDKSNRVSPVFSIILATHSQWLMLKYVTVCKKTTKLRLSDYFHFLLTGTKREQAKMKTETGQITD